MKTNIRCVSYNVINWHNHSNSTCNLNGKAEQKLRKKPVLSQAKASFTSKPIYWTDQRIKKGQPRGNRGYLFNKKNLTVINALTFTKS